MYDFKQLSPADFEDLTRDLLQQHWGVRLEAFKSGRDHGIDLRYAAIPGQTIIIQCKHYAGSSVTKLEHDLRTHEAPKVARLAPGRYVLVTSLPLNPSDKQKILVVLDPYIRSSHDILGAEDIDNLLGLHPAIETQHFKLWLSSAAVLQRVLHNAEQVQTNFDVERVRRAIPLYVQSSNYTRAMKLLDEHKVVIVSGVPGIGKTTLADMLLFAHLESSYHPIVIKSDIVEGRKQFNPELKQVFYFDDFLGETFLGNRFDFLGKKEDSAILDFMEIIARSKHARLILTSREHILQNAFQISERFQRQRSGLTGRRCVLQMSDYTLIDRGRILYNHIYFSDLPCAYKAALLQDEFYMEVLKHRNFNPRLIEWLSRYTNVKALPVVDYQGEVARVLENPEQLWRTAFEQQISEASRSVLLALYSLGGEAPLERLEQVWKLLHQHRARKYNWKTAPEDWRRSLQDLEGGFLMFEGGNAAFVNPSVRDFLDTTLCSDVEHVDDLLASACLFEQICHIWSLASSEKGGQLRTRFEESPSQLMEAVQGNLQKPYEQTITYRSGVSGSKKLDVRPEVRLGTAISISDRTKSTAALETTAQYARIVINFWSSHVPDFGAAAGILRALDRAEWQSLLKLDLHGQIKDAILCDLMESAGSNDIAELVGYAKGEGGRWTNEDQKKLVRIVKDYLENGFDEELVNCDSESELGDFAGTLQDVANWCEVDVQACQNLIHERIAEFTRSEEDDGQPARQWVGANEPMSDRMQEAEVKRLFDGLGYS